MSPQDKQYVDFLYSSLLQKINQKQIFYDNVPLSGFTDCCSVFGINSSNGNLYYKSDIGTWLPVPSTTSGGGGGSSIISKESFISDNTGTLVYTVPSNYLLQTIVIIPSANCNPFCGFTLGTPQDIVPQDVFNTTTPSEGVAWAINVLGATPRSVTLGGLATGSNVTFIKINLS